MKKIEEVPSGEWEEICLIVQDMDERETWSKEEVFLIPQDQRQLLFTSVVYGLINFDEFETVVEAVTEVRTREVISNFNEARRADGSLTKDLLLLDNAGRVFINLAALELHWPKNDSSQSEKPSYNTL